MSFIEFGKDFPLLEEKTVVITGGTSGIGAGFVRLACQNGANVVFRDLNSDLGKAVASETGAAFVKTDVTIYKEQLGLLREAFRKHGKIDHAIANAGIYEPKGAYDPELDLITVENEILLNFPTQEPSTPASDTNVRGAGLFTHIASVYLRQSVLAGEDESITIISSVSSAHCPSDTPFYNRSKAGMLGLIRSLAQVLPTSHGIQVNGISPSITATPLASLNMLPIFEAAGIAINRPTDIAEFRWSDLRLNYEPQDFVC